MKQTTSGAKRLPAELSLLVLGLGTDPNLLVQRIRRAAPSVFARLDVAADLESAREAAQHDHYDVVLLDCDPLRHGPEEVGEHVRAFGVTPVIAISHVDDFAIQEQLLRVGVQDYLVKKRTYANQLISSVVHSIERKRLETRLKSALGELAEANARLKRLTLRDSLTGVLNRRAFLSFADQAIARAERNGSRLVLLYCDLDRFKEINDTLGHNAGDEYLRTFCRRLRSTLRKSDTIGRLEGDEFVILLENADWDEALETVQRIRQATMAPLDLDGHTARPGVSIGIASYPNQRTVKDLIHQADKAMYAVKKRKRGQANNGPGVASSEVNLA